MCFKHSLQQPEWHALSNSVGLNSFKSTLASVPQVSGSLVEKCASVHDETACWQRGLTFVIWFRSAWPSSLPSWTNAGGDHGWGVFAFIHGCCRFLSNLDLPRKVGVFFFSNTPLHIRSSTRSHLGAAWYNHSLLLLDSLFNGIQQQLLREGLLIHFPLRDFSQLIQDLIQWPSGHKP